MGPGLCRGETSVDSLDVDRADVDSAHVDSAHVDSARVDSAHVDSARVDSAHVDSAHVDSAHVDGAHVNAKKFLVSFSKPFKQLHILIPIIAARKVFPRGGGKAVRECELPKGGKSDRRRGRTPRILPFGPFRVVLVHSPWLAPQRRRWFPKGGRRRRPIIGAVDGQRKGLPSGPEGRFPRLGDSLPRALRPQAMPQGQELGYRRGGRWWLA